MSDAARVTLAEVERATYYAALILNDYGPLLDGCEPNIAERMVAASAENNEAVTPTLALAVAVGLRTGIMLALAKEEETE